MRDAVDGESPFTKAPGENGSVDERVDRRREEGAWIGRRLEPRGDRPRRGQIERDVRRRERRAEDVEEGVRAIDQRPSDVDEWPPRGAR